MRVISILDNRRFIIFIGIKITYPAEERELVTIFTVRDQIFRFRLQHTAHRRSGEVFHGAIDGQTAEKYILGLGCHEYRVRFVEDAVDGFAYVIRSVTNFNECRHIF